MTALFQSEGEDHAEAEWSPTGERVVVAVGRGAKRRVVVHDVGRGGEGDAAWPSRSSLSAGTTLETLEPGYNSGRQVATSP